MTDIVERLRNVFPSGWEGEMRHKAADEIERLREVLLAIETACADHASRVSIAMIARAALGENNHD